MAKLPIPFTPISRDIHVGYSYLNNCRYYSPGYLGGSQSTYLSVWNVRQYRFTFKFESENQQIAYLNSLPLPPSNFINNVDYTYNFSPPQSVTNTLIALYGEHQISSTTTRESGLTDLENPIDFEENYSGNLGLRHIYPLHYSYYGFQESIFNRSRSTLKRPFLQYTPANYINLVDGYHLDSRSRPDKITISTPKNYQPKIIKIGFYRKNPFEKYKKQYVTFHRKTNSYVYRVTNQKPLTTIDWVSFDLKLEANKTYQINTENIVIGTLWLTEDDRQGLTITSDGTYPLEFIYHNPAKTAELYQYWLSLYEQYIIQQANTRTAAYRLTVNHPQLPINSDAYLPSDSINTYYFTFLNLYSSFIRRTNQAFYNPWDENWQPLEDENFRADHPLFDFNDDEYAALPNEPSWSLGGNPNEIVGTFKQYFEIQSDGSRGILTMDSPRIVEIHDRFEKLKDALELDTYARLSDDENTPRPLNLGKMISLIYQILGGCLNENLEIDRDYEKNNRIGEISSNPTYGVNEYSLTGFGEKGMILKHLPNQQYSQGGYEKIPNLPQLLISILQQIDKSLGIQENSNIRFPNMEGTDIKYHNQSAMLIDMAVALDELTSLVRQIHVSSLVTQKQTSEVIHGLGNTPSTKFIKIRSEQHKKDVQIPYIGVTPAETLQKDLLEIKANIAIILGQIL